VAGQPYWLLEEKQEDRLITNKLRRKKAMILFFIKLFWFNGLNCCNIANII